MLSVSDVSYVLPRGKDLVCFVTDVITQIPSLVVGTWHSPKRFCCINNDINCTSEKAVLNQKVNCIHVTAGIFSFT